MALKDYKNSMNYCIINNHPEFVTLLKWFLEHGAENYCGGDIPMFEYLYDLLDELKVKYEDYTYEGDDEYGGLLIKSEDELEEFLLKNINEDTYIPSQDEYPVLVSWYKAESFDRIGDTSMKLLTFTSLNQIKPMKNYLEDYMKEVVKNNEW